MDITFPVGTFYRQPSVTMGAVITQKRAPTAFRALNVQAKSTMTAYLPVPSNWTAAIGTPKGPRGIDFAAHRTNLSISWNEVITITTWVLVTDHLSNLLFLLPELCPGIDAQSTPDYRRWC